MKSFVISFVLCFSVCGTSLYAAAIVEDFHVDPTDSGNGWACQQRTGNITIYTIAGTCNIDSMGDGSVSPQFYESGPPATTEQWACAEMIVTVYASEPTTSEYAAIGASVVVSNYDWQYMMGVRTLDLGGGIYQTKVAVFDGFAYYLWKLGEYTLPDTGINQHRYNAELNMTTGQLKIYIDGYIGDSPVLTVTAGGGSSIAVRFGDNRSGDSAYYTGTPNANATYGKITISTNSLLPPAPYCGDENTVYLSMDLTGPEGAPDCYVDFRDLAVFLEYWARCTDPADDKCEGY